MSRVYFISGHRDITQEEFDKYYLEILDKVAVPMPRVRKLLIVELGTSHAREKAKREP